MATANAYELVFALKDGRTDGFTLFAYNAMDAFAQGVFLVNSRNGEDCGAKIVHLGPPVDVWDTAKEMREAVKRALAVMKGQAVKGQE